MVIIIRNGIGYPIPDIGLAVRVFANSLGDLDSNPRSSHTKNLKNGT